MTRLLDLLDTRSVDLDFTADSADQAIDKMVGLLDQAGAVADVDAFAAAVKAREATSSTGLGDGIAIPHGKSDGVTRPALAFARSSAEVDWNGAPARLIFLIGVPADQAGDEHLRILAMLARRLVRPAFRESLVNARGADEIRAILSEVGA